VETCVYHQVDEEGTVLDYTIIGFRGTASKGDLYDDFKLSMKGNDGDFPRAQEGIAFTQQYLQDNPEMIIQLTGHSLGGAIAREVGQALGLGIITFNAAAPPSNPVITGPNEIDYHIVFDVISAWQGPNTVRIDKGYRPNPKYWNSINFISWGKYTVNELVKAHALSNFSNQKTGVIVNAQQEDHLMQVWFLSTPTLLRGVLISLLSLSGKVVSLPKIIN
jgi:hypothetical protein